MVDGTPVEFSIPKNIIVEIYKVVGNYRRQWTGPTKCDIPRPSSRRTESGDAHIYHYDLKPAIASSTSAIIPQPSYLNHHTSSIYSALPSPILRTHLSRTNEPTKSKVHKVSRNPRIVWCIEASSHFYLSCFYCARRFYRREATISCSFPQGLIFAFETAMYFPFCLGIYTTHPKFHYNNSTIWGCLQLV